MVDVPTGITGTKVITATSVSKTDRAPEKEKNDNAAALQSRSVTDEVQISDKAKELLAKDAEKAARDTRDILERNQTETLANNKERLESVA